MSEQKYLVTETQLTNIATAIRLQRDSTAMIEVDDMPMEIGLIDKDAFKLTECSTFEGDVIADKYLQDGVERSYTGWLISPYFNIFGAKVIVFKPFNNNTFPNPTYCEFYDSNKVYVGSLITYMISGLALFEVPTGVKYVRTSASSYMYADGKSCIPYMLQRDIVVPPLSNVVYLGKTEYQRNQYQTAWSSVRVPFTGFTDPQELYDLYGPGGIIIKNKCVRDSDPMSDSIPYVSSMYIIGTSDKENTSANRGETIGVVYKDDYGGTGRQYGGILNQVSMRSTAYEWQAIQLATDPVTYFPKGDYVSEFYYMY